MTRTIKAREVKPGMNIRFDLEGWDVKGTVARMHRRPQGMWLYTDQSFELSLDLDSPVTVLAEPQPKEPVTLCARIVVAGRKIYRWTEDPKEPWPWRGEALNVDPVLWSWGQLCGLGHVTVIDADPPWTAPKDTPVDAPVVPERVEEWPEDDEHLRAYRWRDRDGDLWYSISDSRTPWVVGFTDRTGAFHPYPKRGPFTRVTDA